MSGWHDPATRAAARYSLADFATSFTDDPLEIDPEFTRWRAQTAGAGAHYQQAMDGPPEPRGQLIDGAARRPVINLSAYNYLGLARHPKVVAAAGAALERYGVGACGSPMISGRTGMHDVLEQRLSRFLGRERTMLFNSGYAGVLGVTAGLLRRGMWRSSTPGSTSASSTAYASPAPGCGSSITTTPTRSIGR